MNYSILIVLGLVIFIVLIYFIATQRKFIGYDEINQNALSQIGLQQEARWNALVQLVNATKSYADFERDTLIEVVSKRQPLGQNPTVDQLNAQESLLDQAMSRLLAISERYPDLKSSTLYSNTMQSINSYEKDVKMSKMVFNDTVTKYNRLTRQFPSSIVAGILGYRAKEYLKVENKKQEYPELNF